MDDVNKKEHEIARKWRYRLTSLNSFHGDACYTVHVIGLVDGNSKEWRYILITMQPRHLIQMLRM